MDLVFQTSGTTGEPKEVRHSFDAMYANAQSFVDATGLDASVRMYHCLPREHMAGFLNTVLVPMAAGGVAVFRSVFSPKPALYFWAHFYDERCNALWVTPTIATALIRMYRGHGADSIAGHLENVFCGTAPLSVATRQEWFDVFGFPLRESYGTSEHMLVSVQGYDDASNLRHDAGHVLPGVDVAIADTGEIVVNGTGTGDLGTLTDGRLAITGRIRDVIIKGGINVSPRRVEEAARQAGIRDCAAVGQPDEFWGERIALYVEGGDLAQVMAKCQELLPKSHVPDDIYTVDALPRNAMGKVQKSLLPGMVAA